MFAAQDAAAHLAYTVAALAGGLLVALVGVRGAFAAAAACTGSAFIVALRLPTGKTPVERAVENR